MITQYTYDYGTKESKRTWNSLLNITNPSGEWDVSGIVSNCYKIDYSLYSFSSLKDSSYC